MAHVFMLGGLPESLINFRGALIADLIAAGHRVTAAAGGESAQVTQTLSSLGVSYIALPLRRAGSNPLDDLRFRHELTKALTRSRPTDLFAYTVKPIIYGSAAARRAGVPRVHALVTGLGYAFMQSRSLRQRLIGALVPRMYRRALARCDTVLFQNPDDEALFRHRGILSRHAHSTVINGSGVDLDYFAAAPLPGGPPVFLLVARLLRDKGIEEYAQAASMLAARYPQAKFLLVGPEDPNPAAVSLSVVRGWERGGALQYMGSVEDVRPYLAQSCVYVLPSYREGTPRTVLEAMATGRAIVTTDVPGCRETVIAGDNGLLVPARDAKALAQAMERFIVEPQLIERMGRRSRELAERKYDVHKVNQAVLGAIGLTGGPRTQ